MRCTGHCCKTFTLPFSPEELQENYEHWKRTAGAEEGLYTSKLDAFGHRCVEDIWIIAPMVRLLTHSDTHPITGEKFTNEGYWYTCAHWNKETGDCGIYAMRPNVCSRYPYGRPCDHAERGCTMTNGDGVEERDRILPKVNGGEPLRVLP